MKQKLKNEIIDYFKAVKFSVRIVYPTKKHLQKNSLREIIITISGVQHRVYTISKICDSEDKTDIKLMVRGGYAERDLGNVLISDEFIIEFWNKLIHDDYEACECSANNFFHGTNAIFNACEKPKTKCFSVLEDGSEYYYENGSIIIFSNYWGIGIKENNWFCKQGIKYVGYAKCKLSMFTPNNMFLKFENKAR